MINSNRYHEFLTEANKFFGKFLDILETKDFNEALEKLTMTEKELVDLRIKHPDKIYLNDFLVYWRFHDKVLNILIENCEKRKGNCTSIPKMHTDAQK